MPGWKEVLTSGCPGLYHSEKLPVYLRTIDSVCAPPHSIVPPLHFFALHLRLEGPRAEHDLGLSKTELFVHDSPRDDALVVLRDVDSIHFIRSSPSDAIIGVVAGSTKECVLVVGGCCQSKPSCTDHLDKLRLAPVARPSRHR